MDSIFYAFIVLMFVAVVLAFEAIYIWWNSRHGVAAKRIENPKFPVPFEITNADVMVQGSELRGMVDVMARLDRDGQAGPAQPGDIEGRYAKNPTLPGGRDLEIILDSVKQ